VMKFRCTLNSLLLTILAVMDKFLSGYKRKDRNNEAGSSKNNNEKHFCCRQHEAK